MIGINSTKFYLNITGIGSWTSTPDSIISIVNVQNFIIIHESMDVSFEFWPISVKTVCELLSRDISFRCFVNNNAFGMTDTITITIPFIESAFLILN
ncbi:hypothetical protein D1B17_09265 [Companilactobacillus zhachilii]|uniref:Uncharacterized protein n=1 Tax=Companilactobacillus zhachilii TaxID=2304606 RepID=A0A386PVZ6_9LACO|nr:hypothetical protein D1B17_09265 [Companilactobacillus zhachilii]